MGSYFRDYFSPKAHERATVGDTKMSFTTWDHLGWLNCDGRSLSVANYYILWQVIGYTFGGSGANFNLPDMRGRVPGAPGTGPGPTTYALGNSVGEQVHQLTIGEMPRHTHGPAAADEDEDGTGVTADNTTGITTEAHSHTYTITNSDNVDRLDGLSNANSGTTAGANTNSVTVDINDPGHNHAIGTTGNDQTHNNMQPTLFIGNTFIFCGILSRGRYPYTSGTNLY